MTSWWPHDLSFQQKGNQRTIFIFSLLIVILWNSENFLSHLIPRKLFLLAWSGFEPWTFLVLPFHLWAFDQSAIFSPNAGINYVSIQHFTTTADNYHQDMAHLLGSTRVAVYPKPTKSLYSYHYCNILVSLSVSTLCVIFCTATAASGLSGSWQSRPDNDYD